MKSVMTIHVQVYAFSHILYKLKRYITSKSLLVPVLNICIETILINKLKLKMEKHIHKIASFKCLLCLVVLRVSCCIMCLLLYGASGHGVL